MAEVTWDPFGSGNDAQSVPQALTCTDTPGSSDWAVFETKNSSCKLMTDGDSDWQDFNQGTKTSECVKTVAETTDSSDTDWPSLTTTNHTSSISPSSSYTFSSDVFQSIFQCDLGTLIFAPQKQQLISHCHLRFLNDLQTNALSVDEFDWSHSLIKDQFLLAHCALSKELFSSTDSTETDAVSLEDFDTFDWNQDSKKSEEATEEKVSFSPELFSYTRAPLDSPIQLEFDLDKAMLGLSLLTAEELYMMRDELAAKVKKLSNDLVTALQIRDMVLVESDTKNKFIAALLRVKDRRHSLRNQHQEASSGGLRSWSRPRSLSRGLDWVKRRGSLLEDEKSNDLLLHCVIPYKPNETGVWDIELLKQWTKLLQAISEGSSELPGLLSAYLQSQMVLNTGPKYDQSSPNHQASK